MSRHTSGYAASACLHASGEYQTMLSSKSNPQTSLAEKAANDAGGASERWDTWRRPGLDRKQVFLDYPDVEALRSVEADLWKFPPLVFAGETDALKAQLARVANGEAFLFQGGDCAESFEEHDAGYILDFLHLFLQIAVVLTLSGGDKGMVKGPPVVKVGRIAGQFAKPRSSLKEKKGDVELDSYFGDIVNGPEFTKADRTPDPLRLLRAYRQSAATLNFLRSLIDGGHASLTNAHKWVLKSEGDTVKARYKAILEQLTQAFAALDRFGVEPHQSRSISHTDLWTSHEALLLPYEEALTRRDTLLGTNKWYDTSAHMVWIGDRTRSLDHACVEFCSGIANPIGLKCGPSIKANELVELTKRLNPENEPGKLTLICRFGADKVAELLPPLIEAVQKAGAKVVWSCDPMHGNTISVKADGREYKTRPFDRIMAEINGFFDVHEKMGTYPGGVHVEMTGKSVTECTGGSAGLTNDDLQRMYSSRVDPRLNANQALELAFLVADRIKKYGQRKA